MYKLNNQKVVENRHPFKWIMQGRPDRAGGPANLEVMLSFDFVKMPDGTKGIAIAPGIAIPKEIGLNVNESVIKYSNPWDEGGTNVWLTTGNGIALVFEGDTYFLAKPETVIEGLGGIVYFGFLPTEWSKGEIVWSKEMFYESSIIS